MKRIIVCSTNYLPHIGGAEIAIDEITKHIQKEDYSFDLITARLNRKLPKKEIIGNVVVHRVGLGFAFDKFLLPFLGCIRFISLRLSKKYDIVWSMMASQGSVLASFISTLFRIPLVLTLQEGDEEKHLERYALGNKMLFNVFILPWYTFVFKKAKRITVISNYLKERARLHANAPIDLVPNGVDIKKFSFQKDSLEVSRIVKKYDLQGKKIIVSASRLVYKNNIEILIKALPLLPKETVLLLVGDGPKRKELQNIAEDLGVVPRVIFVGSVTPGDVPPYLWVSDIFARLSKSEGFGSAFIEAFAAGIPVVATPVGGIVDFLEEGKTGLYADPNDEKDVAHVIGKLLHDSGLREELVKNAKNTLEHYSWRHIVSLMKRSFDQM